MKFVKEFVARHERILTSAAFIAGFFIDAFTFSNIDIRLAAALFAVHLCIVGIGIAGVHVITSRAIDTPFARRTRAFLSLAAYFSLGALSSGFLAFYLLSGSARANWPFLLFLFSIFAANEWLHSYRKRLVFQASMYFVMIFSFAILAVPLILSAIGLWPFLIAAALSAVLFAVYLVVVFWAGDPLFLPSIRPIIFATSGALVLIMGFYFTNVIPPVPLSLKDGGAYYRVERAAGGYQVVYEDEPWYARFDPRPRTLHLPEGDSAAVFSSIFAPAGLSTQVVHEWQRKSGQSWVTESTISFPIAGGRDGGYRGYSVKDNPEPGLWRVNVKTERGQVIGRIDFRIERQESQAMLYTETVF